jgi:hypothetical protein
MSRLRTQTGNWSRGRLLSRRVHGILLDMYQDYRKGRTWRSCHFRPHDNDANENENENENEKFAWWSSDWFDEDKQTEERIID